ncbi:MAG: hypothetical protein JSU75_04605 [Gammaproteobacteria bacterium]|nr:MAG: hypothetical protein JSU75_04605 [Gammaproteobacteria bacterium]
MFKRMVLLCLLLAGIPGSPLMAEEADTDDKSTESGQQPADAESKKPGDNDKKPGSEEDEEEPECD